ncbi:MAG: hypothetical protein AAFQ44_00705 [Pseudomonadota bacterium]
MTTASLSDFEFPTQDLPEPDRVDRSNPDRPVYQPVHNSSAGQRPDDEAGRDIERRREGRFELVAPVDLTDDTDDEPMPIPSTWRGDSAQKRRRRGGAVSPVLTGAAAGFALGSIIVLPIVLMATGHMTRDIDLMPSVTAASSVITDSREATETTKTGPATTPPVPQFLAGHAGSLPEPATVIAGLATAPVPNLGTNVGNAPPVAAAPKAATAEVVTMEAKSLIASGDLLAARRLLEGADVPPSKAMLFILAETYDPLVLNAWGETAIPPDPARADELYRLALLAGSERAQLRITALRAWTARTNQ